MAFIAKDPQIFFNAMQEQAGQAMTQSSQSRKPTAAENEAADLASVILKDLEKTWGQMFANAGMKYQQPKLVLFSGSIQSACGYASTQSGPFYCSADQKLYLDLAFLKELKRLGAPGDFAFAYVIAHEVGHHISNTIGTLQKVNNMRQRLSKTDGNKLSVLLELQADCFSGVWAKEVNKRGMLEAGDIQEGLQAAASVGDDKLIGNHRPDLFTHGTSAQRVYWLKRGMNGNISSCKTFKEAGVSL